MLSKQCFRFCAILQLLTHLILLSTLLAPFKKHGNRYREVKELAQGDSYQGGRTRMMNISTELRTKLKFAVPLQCIF